MNAFLSNLLFMNPWLLLGLLGLPALWWLLRITPPSPRLVRLPTARFLKDLIPQTRETSQTPLWLLLLRMLIIALVITALAGPVYNPGTGLGGTGELRLVMDNGWSSAHLWETQRNAGRELIAQAQRNGRPVTLMTTAPQAGQDRPVYKGPLSAAEALSVLNALSPLAWPADYNAARAVLDDAPDPEKRYETYWLADSLSQPGFRALQEKLEQQGGLTYIKPKNTDLPLTLGTPDPNTGRKEAVVINAPDNIAEGLPVTIQALRQDGRILDHVQTRLEASNLPQTVELNVPDALRGEISQYRLAGNYGAGGVVLLDERFRNRAVGIIADEGLETTADLTQGAYYLRRALEPYADLEFGDIPDITNRSLSMIILPDIGAMPVDSLNALEEWVQAGGLLLRFAGPNMLQNLNVEQLLAVPLRQSDRALDGALTWEKPLKLAPFAQTSPFFGIPVPEDTEIRKQILPRAGADLEGKVWAALEDGTPLITAKQEGQGMIVLVHTTASPDWSNLPLSGLFVNILKRLNAMSGMPASRIMEKSGASLDPVIVLDGRGTLQTPDATVHPLKTGEAEDMKISARHPPGLYGRGAVHVALNIGDENPSLRTVDTLGPGTAVRTYEENYELSLQPYLLYAAAWLVLLDWLLMSLLGASWPGIRTLWRRIAPLAVLAVLCLPAPANAQSLETITQADRLYASGLYLAYIKTGDPAQDALSQSGLENLARELAARTSAEPDGVAGLNPETDNMAFFPWIYWPVSAAQKTPPSSAALHNIQHYLDHGGTILFDLREGTNVDTTQNARLRTITEGLNIPLLQPVPKDHVLTKSFYLLDNFPGRHISGKLWVEASSERGRDGVSSVIIGSNDWASAWAADAGAASFMGGTRQHELAMRTGINLTMYALTGNYKADQVHVPYILERLDR